MPKKNAGCDCGCGCGCGCGSKGCGCRKDLAKVIRLLEDLRKALAQSEKDRHEIIRNTRKILGR